MKQQKIAIPIASCLLRILFVWQMIAIQIQRITDVINLTFMPYIEPDGSKILIYTNRNHIYMEYLFMPQSLPVKLLLDL